MPNTPFTHPDEEEAQLLLHKKIAKQKKTIRRNQLTQNFQNDAMWRKTWLQVQAIKGIVHVDSWSNKVKDAPETSTSTTTWLDFVSKQLQPAPQQPEYNKVDSKYKPNTYIESDLVGEQNKNFGKTHNAPVVGKAINVRKEIVDYREYFPVIDNKAFDVKIKVGLDVSDPIDICDAIFKGMKELHHPLYVAYGAQSNIENAPELCFILHK